MKNTVLILAGILFLSNCSTEVISEAEGITANSTKAEDDKYLADLLKSIETTAGSQSCSNAADWKWTQIGAKPCGGPSGYIAYHKSIDEKAFLANVKIYSDAMKAYNTKTGLMGDCSLPAEPKGVTCDQNKAVLTY